MNLLELERRCSSIFGLILLTFTSFGAAAFALEMVPFASLAFAYTNAVGAALWASSLENASDTDKTE